MIAFISGTVQMIRNDSLVINVHGVGYEVFVSNSLSQKLNEEVFLYTYQHVREDAIHLFGFFKEEDYEVFMRLINVKGIGPKTAQSMLAVCSGQDMIRAIEEDDIKKLKSLPGIGAKTAGQIVLDLKGKFVSISTGNEGQESPVWKETQEALMALGYKANQLGSVKKELSSKNDMDVNEMLRQALSILAKRNGV